LVGGFGDASLVAGDLVVLALAIGCSAPVLAGNTDPPVSDSQRRGHFADGQGEKRYEKDEEDKNRHMSERAYGAFERSFALPSGVDRDKIAANLEKGVLTITLPKTPEAQKQQKKIEVKSAT
jgi:Hsp20/alpha crystallin family protein